MGMRSLQNDRGSAFVELALVVPLLCLVLIGAAELGRIAYYAIEVSDAARAGVAYGSLGSGTANAADMETAASASAPDVTLTFPAPSGGYTPCVCETINKLTGVTFTTPIRNCGDTDSTADVDCPASTVTGITKLQVNYVQLSTQAQVSTMFHYPGIPTSFTLHGYAKMRMIQ